MSIEDPNSVRSDNKSTRFEIAGIFRNTSLSSYYTKEQKLRFIFNNGVHEFVFMTTTHQFVFEYAKFSCKFDVVVCGQIVTNFDPDERGATIYANQLFDNYANETANIKDLPNEENDNIQFDFNRTLIIFLLVLLIILVICDMLIARKVIPLKSTFWPNLSEMQTATAYPMHPSETTSIDTKDVRAPEDRRPKTEPKRKSPVKSTASPGARAESVKTLAQHPKQTPAVKSSPSLKSLKSLKSLNYPELAGKGKVDEKSTGLAKFLAKRKKKKDFL